MSSTQTLTNKNVNINSEQIYDEKPITDEQFEHEELKEAENIFGIVIIKTRTAVYEQITRVFKILRNYLKYFNN